jgi:hypothetical protein
MFEMLMARVSAIACGYEEYPTPLPPPNNRSLIHRSTRLRPTPTSLQIQRLHSPASVLHIRRP